MDLATDHEINKVKKVGTSPPVENLVKCLSRYPKSGILNTQEIGAYRTRMGKIISQKKIQEAITPYPWAIFSILKV